MGVRFAFTGGREGWIRVLLTAVGVGLGVALLLLTTAIPNALGVRHSRDDARLDYTYGPKRPKAANTLLISDSDTTYHGDDVRGRLVEPEGPKAPLAPGLSKYPAPGEMVVSPALKKLLDSGDGRLLRERLPYRIVGTIGESGLIGSQELAYYAGAKSLAPRIDGYRTARITEFGRPTASSNTMDPVLILLVLVVFAVLLTPVAVFIATAVRFGGERRDRRLAALRLVGSDTRMTRRIAAGEALAGSLVGLVFGTVFFLLGRQLAGSVEIVGISVFPSYLNPTPALAALVAVAVPAAAVLVTLFALRGVVIEPLGVVRTAKPTRRRLWWRLLLPVGGLALLAPMIGQGRGHGDFNPYLVIGGVLLLLIGVTTLLPWIVEAVVARLGRGGLAWQLAVRRLQLSSGTAARMVNGIAVAVAGAIAMQMLFAGIQSEYTKNTGHDTTRAQMQVNLSRGVDFLPTAAKFSATKGVRKATALGSTDLGDQDWRRGPTTTVPLTVGTCDALREEARVTSCHDGDAFVARGASNDADVAKLVRPGRTLHINTTNGIGPGNDAPWTVPGRLKPATAITGPTGMRMSGVLLTPAAIPERLSRLLTGVVYVSVDRSVPDAQEHIRNTAARIDPLADTMLWSATERSKQFDSIRTGTFAGAICVLALIGTSLLVSQLEQLRERRKLLSSLVAFGTRRRTLSLSVLWQTAIPIGLGLLLATAVGLTLGAVLLQMAGVSVGVDWSSVLSMTAVGAAVVLTVTALSLPPLIRMMRPEGLRTE
ncbi:ABC transporter permease [Streptomyces broussonetiae]|uniref:FtsX-like permease family protein n=1 Tax=Streptomyces broussonetiae TaxID=2686304 RepID=A0A6I6N7F7_9ACTN|nr:FtsX-like permease family protein [Streptomyces broussonetiae]QHA06549.1 FtsX-like permease family protein [Streptomyces broussonetiae]